MDSEIDSSTFVSLDVDSQNHSEEQRAVKAARRRPKIKRTWKLEKRFLNANEAVRFVKSENIWSTSTTNIVAQGKKVLYRCKRARQREKQCEAAVTLLFCSDSNAVLFHRAQNSHTCKINPTRRMPMTDDIKDKVTILFKDGYRKRKEIEAQLAAEHMRLPSTTHLNNLIRDLRIEAYKK